MDSKKYPGVYVDKKHNTCMISWSINGRRFRESAHTKDPNEAYLLRCKRIAETETGATTEPSQRKVTFQELADDVERNYITKRNRSLVTLRYRLKPILAFFGYRLASAITSAEVDKYVEARREAKRSDGTIRQELMIIRRAFILGVRNGKVRKRLYFDLPKPSPSRKGFFERPEFDAVCQHLPDEIRPIAEFGYITGWRLREVMWLTWGQVDFTNEQVNLYAEQSKNGKARSFPFTKALRQLLLERKAERLLHCPYVFHRNGRQIHSFRDAWKYAREKAGVAYRIFHDLRRTAVRNLVRAGVPIKVAMEMCGHETMEIAFRYDIISLEDKRQAAKKLDALLTRPEGA